MNLIDQWRHMFPDFLPGLWITLKLTAGATALGFPLGVLLASASMAKPWPVRWLAIVIVEIGRGAPGLITLYVVYYGLPQVDVTWSSFLSAVLAMALTTGAYSAEIFRVGLKAVPHGQREASRAVGLSGTQEFRLVVLPQAIRLVIPPLVGLVILIYQGTSLAYAVAVPELLSRAYNTGTITFQFTPPLLLAGLMYAVVSLAGIALVRLRRPRRRSAGPPAAGPATRLVDLEPSL